MKKYFVLTAAFLIFGATVARAQDDVNGNANAPANYDANLRAGARAVAKLSDLETITVVSKSGGVYRAKLDDGTDNVYLFRANAVYPYFDLQEFGNIISGKEDLIAPYLECYAKKRGADFEKLKSDGFRPPYFGDANEMKTELQSGQAKLAQIEAALKTLAARPDTFLDYTQNPAVWSDIAANRAEYLPCALGDRRTEDIKDSPWLRAHRDGVKKVLSAVENYRAGSGDSMNSGSEYAFYAISLKMRADWLKEKNALDFKDEIDKLLKPLAAALAEKLPTYFPNAEKYAIRNPAEEALMKRVLTNPARSPNLQNRSGAERVAD